MELTQLKYFLEVAKTEHVTQSAKNLCIVQPALTQSIHKLEDELGVSLFKNVGRNIKLTDSGKFFYKQLQPIYNDMMALPQKLKEVANKQNNVIRLNVLAASTIVTNAVIEFKRDNPDVDIDMLQNQETDMFDICVRTYANYKPDMDNTKSDDTFICSERIFLAVQNTAQYKKMNSISLFDLKDVKFIRLYGSKQYRKICNELCDRIGFTPTVTFESDNTTALKEAVAAGIGVGFWPEVSWGNMDLKRIRLLEITDTEFKRDIVVSLRKNKQDNTRMEAFYIYLKKYIQKNRQKRNKAIAH